jgi:hypothetical protein
VAKLVTIFWRDIPAQVVGKRGRDSIKQQLTPRFALAIDRAAMRAGRGSSDAYLADWRRETRDVEGDLAQAVAEEVRRLEESFPEDKLKAAIKAGGIVPAQGENS